MKTMGELCKQLNVKPYQIDYLIRNRLIPTPQKLASGHRIFVAEDIKQIKIKLFEMKIRGGNEN